LALLHGAPVSGGRAVSATALAAQVYGAVKLTC
jgi:hypothetical protein